MYATASQRSPPEIYKKTVTGISKLYGWNKSNPTVNLGDCRETNSRQNKTTGICPAQRRLKVQDGLDNKW
jgi:hypothetical protein